MYTKFNKMLARGKKRERCLFN